MGKDMKKEPEDQSIQPQPIRKNAKAIAPASSSGVGERASWSGFVRYEPEQRKSLRPRSPQSTAFSLRDFLLILFKHKVQIVLFFLFVVAAVTFITFKINPTYVASAQLFVKLGRESVFIPAIGSATPILNINREEVVNSEIEIIKSHSLAEKVISYLGPTDIYRSLREHKPGILDRIWPHKVKILSPDERAKAELETAVWRFQKALDVTGIRNSNVIEVTFKHQDPQMAATVVNTLAKMYLDEHLIVHKSPQNVKFFQEQSQLLKAKLDQAEKKLRTLKEKYNISSFAEQRSLLLKQSTDISTDLDQTISQIAETEKRVLQIRRQLGVTAETIAQGEETDQNPYLINTLETRLVELELKEKELATKFTDDSRLVKSVRDEIRIIKDKIADQATKSYGRKRSGINPTYQNLQQELLRYEADIQALGAKQGAQRANLAKIQTNLEQLNNVELELSQLEQEVEVDRASYRLYLEKFEQSRISDAMDAEKITGVSLISTARSPRKPVSPKVILNILIGIVLGFFGALTLAFFREYLDDKLERVEDVEGCLGLPVLASIPELKAKKTKSKKTMPIKRKSLGYMENIDKTNPTRW
jgi:uncharacterized protein involved in exopolysaccharide biosynthesis